MTRSAASAAPRWRSPEAALPVFRALRSSGAPCSRTGRALVGVRARSADRGPGDRGAAGRTRLRPRRSDDQCPGGPRGVGTPGDDRGLSRPGRLPPAHRSGTEDGRTGRTRGTGRRRRPRYCSRHRAAGDPRNHGSATAAGLVLLAAWPVPAADVSGAAPWALRPAPSVVATAGTAVGAARFLVEAHRHGAAGVAERVVTAVQCLWPFVVVVTSCLRRPEDRDESPP